MKRTIITIIALACALIARAQGQQMPPLPNDPEVKTGKLENGMTYYIRHNSLPEGRCEFYLATNVGAIQETPDQDGLAHFLEHMCFNGLKNLPGKQMLDYLQHIGAEFGRNINASTGVEHTQYMLNNIPVTREGIIDTCLLVMHDYSHFVLNEASEIDAERGVILEEKRTRNTAGWRMFEKALPYIYGKDSKYAGCNIIGSEDNLKNFKPESLRAFYSTWYRPDMQALIVIGDIDVEQIYSKVVKLFADIPAPETPTVKEMPKVEINDNPVVGIITDPENSSTSVEFIWKLGEPTPKEINGTQVGYMERLLKRIIAGVMEERFNDITMKADAPFLSARLGIYDLCETCEAMDGDLSCDNAKTLTAIEAYLTEVERMKRFGFTDDEVNRVKNDIIKGKKDRVAGAATRKNPEFVYPVIDHFFSGVSYLTPETDLQLTEMICSQLNAAVMNQIIPQILSEEHLTVIYTGVEKEGQVHPAEDAILDIIKKVKASDIKPNETEAVDSDFMKGIALKAAKVKKEETALYGSTVWTLSNGLRVVVLPTEYKKNQVIFNLRRDGGLSLIPTEDLPSVDETLSGIVAAYSGVAGFSKPTVDKMLSGKTVYVNASISESYASISGSCTPEDFETAMQLIYLKWAEPRFDPEEWGTSINLLNSVIPNMMSNPSYKLNQHIYADLFNNPRRNVISPEIIAKANLDTYAKCYRTVFSDIAGATLYVIGNVDLAAIKPIVAKYCGNLPKGKKAGKWNTDNIIKVQKGTLEDVFNTKMETPKATVLQYYSADVPFTLEKTVNLTAAEFILDMIYTETLREQEGGTYGASASLGIDFEPFETASAQIYFDTNVEQQKRLRELAVKGLADLAENGPTEEQLLRAVENARKNLPEKRITNNYWLKALSYNDRRGGDYDREYEQAVNSISAESIKTVLKEILTQGNRKEIVMLPE